MGTEGRKPAIPAGTQFEYRVARLRFTQGYFVRRSVDLWPPNVEGDKLAELDCLAITLDPQLRRVLEIIECKTGAGATGEVDRLIWLRGMSSLAQARSVTFAKLHVAPRTRDLARRLPVIVLDQAAITTAERELGISSEWWPGFHDPEFGETVVKPARVALNSARELRRAGKYLFGSFWFADDFTRVKQLRTLFQLLSEQHRTVPEQAVKLAIGEATTLFTLTALSIGSWRSQLDAPEFRQLVSTELATGLGDAYNLRLLLRRIDELQREQIESLHDAYGQLGVARIPYVVKSLETEVLTPPDWVEAFVELVSRFLKRPALATDRVRWTDLWAANLMGPRNVSAVTLDLFGTEMEELQSGLELAIAFLTRVWKVPPHLFSPSTLQGGRAQIQLPMDGGSDQQATPVVHDRTAVSNQLSTGVQPDPRVHAGATASGDGEALITTTVPTGIDQNDSVTKDADSKNAEPASDQKGEAINDQEYAF